MEKTPMGLIIKRIIQKKNLSPTKLAREIGISKQQIYNTYVRTNFHEGEIEKWAKILDVSKEELTNAEFESSQANDFNNNEVLNSIRKMLEDELKEKNEQIRALQKALEQAQNLSTALLGKSREHLDSKVLPLWPDWSYEPAITIMR